MNVPEVLKSHHLAPSGVIQVGSHHGEEIPMWNSLGLKQVHFEPIISNYKKLMADHPEAVVYPVALGCENCVTEMFCETVNGGQSCSLLEPAKHLEILPWIKFNTRQKVIVCRLDEFEFKGYNFLYIDAQGYEMAVLIGARRTLEEVDVIITEVNRAEVFKDCAQIYEIDSFLWSCGFKRVETEWHGGDFGDALYVRH